MKMLKRLAKVRRLTRSGLTPQQIAVTCRCSVGFARVAACQPQITWIGRAWIDGRDHRVGRGRGRGE